MLKLYYGLAIALLLCIQSSYALTAADEFRNKIDMFTTVKLEFVQRTYDHSAQLIDEQRGHGILQKPGNLFWETLQPIRQQIIKNQQKIWLYDIDLEQVTIDTAESVNKIMIFRLLLDDQVNYEQDFTITKQVDNNAEQFIFTANNEEYGVNMIIVTFVASKLANISVIDTNQAQTTIDFAKVQYLASTNNSFNLIIPDDVDIIDNTDFTKQ